LIDATTGLIFIGNGQYYDPETGRFLTRRVNPNSTNPYMPWNPSGGILVPVGLASVYYSRRKKRSKGMDRLVLFVFVLLMMMNLACCHVPTTPSTGSGEPETAESTQEPSSAATQPAETPSPTETPNPTPMEPTPQCGGYCAAWEGGAGYYDRGKAVKFALDNMGKYLDSEIDPYPGTDCTNFVSYALKAGGLRETETWKHLLRNGPWVNTPELYSFLLGKGFTESREFTNTSDYRGDDPENLETLKNYLRLRENTETMKSENGRVNDIWENFMTNIPNVKMGDLVFYRDDTSANWTHVAMITKAWAPQTQYQWVGTGIQEPLVVDHSGPIEDPTKLPRSMGDTFNDRIVAVRILFGP
jgi:hypothetical protein